MTSNADFKSGSQLGGIPLNGNFRVWKEPGQIGRLKLLADLAM